MVPVSGCEELKMQGKAAVFPLMGCRALFSTNAAAPLWTPHVASQLYRLHDFGRVMLKYYYLWAAVVTFWAAIGALIAVIAFPLASLGSAFVSAVLLGMTVRYLGFERHEQPAFFDRKSSSRAALNGVEGVAVAGWLASTGPSSLGLAVLLLAMAPRTITWCRSLVWPRGLAGKQATFQPPTPGGTPEVIRVSLNPQTVPLMTDRQLILEWRVSFVILQHDWSTIDVLSVIDFRCRCLDELEKRNPAGFAQWMSNGARAASDPTPYMTPNSP